MATVRRLYLKCEHAVQHDNQENHHIVLAVMRTANTGGSCAAVRSVPTKKTDVLNRENTFF
jgi:hypothetical protein